jgi:small-conductance mechanosensitive channel/CRP-like cAMP-binding protein
MGEFYEALKTEFANGHTAWLFALYSLTVVLVRALVARTVRLRALTFFFSMHVVFLLAAAGLEARSSAIAADFRVPGLVFGGVAAVGCIAALLFGVLMGRARVQMPRVLQDVLVAIAALITSLSVLSRAGVNLSGLIATSAVATAMIGFALQDFIGNLAGGLALQVDNSLEVGDWVKIGDVTGKVLEIRWRFVAIETRNWETVMVPNSIIMKNNVVVLGRRQGQPLQLRRWVYFNVDYRFQPSDVIEAVTNAVRGAKLQRMAADPPPNCVLMELGDSYGKYAVRYWLNDIAVDDPTDSEVRTLIYFALQRAGMRLSIPAQAVFVTQESRERIEDKAKQDRERRTLALTHVDLFADLSGEERTVLAQGMRYAPFCKGEVITRQGAEAHWLYLVDDGQVSVRVTDQGLEKEVAQLKGPSFFGEMSLMTGAPRSATVVALGDVECFRLDKDTFKKVLTQRPQIAEGVARVLASRKAELDSAKFHLGIDIASQKNTQADLLLKIQKFFGLTEGS